MSTDTRGARNQQQARVPLIPFVAAANEHIEPAFDSGVLALQTTTRQLGPFDVPSYGYLRHILLLVEASGGTLGAGALSADYPFNLIDQVALEDVNGANLVAPLTGHELFLANCWGGYSFVTDPRSGVDYDGTINARYLIRIPVEIAHHNGMGALANQSSAANYRVRVSLNTSTAPFSTAPTTVPSVRVRGYLEAWTQPDATDLAGRPQATMPPAHGTTQFLSKFIRDVAAGQQTILLPRVGNLIRGMTFVLRTTAGARVAGLPGVPDPIELRWDSRQLLSESAAVHRQRMREAVGDVATVAQMFDGILHYSWDNSVLGHIGDGFEGLYLPTVQSTRLEFVATIPAAGTLTVITNDVAPVQSDPSLRYSELTGTGFEPVSPGTAQKG